MPITLTPVTVTTAPDGTRLVTMPASQYEDLVDALESTMIAHDVALGRSETFSSAEMLDCVANPLSFWRRRRGLTQAELAERVGVQQATLSQLESGARNGSVGLLRKLAAALSVTLEDIVVAVDSTDVEEVNPKQDVSDRRIDVVALKDEVDL